MTTQSILHCEQSWCFTKQCKPFLNDDHCFQSWKRCHDKKVLFRHHMNRMHAPAKHCTVISRGNKLLRTVIPWKWVVLPWKRVVLVKAQQCLDSQGSKKWSLSDLLLASIIHKGCALLRKCWYQSNITWYQSSTWCQEFSFVFNVNRQILQILPFTDRKMLKNSLNQTLIRNFNCWCVFNLAIIVH